MDPRPPHSMLAPLAALLAFPAALFAGASGLAAAQAEELAQDLAPPAAPVMRAAHGAALVDGELLGAGPDYKVRFRDGGFELTPALGRAAPRNLPLAFQLESIARGGAVVLAPDGRSAPELSPDGVVRYAHAGGIEERYEMRADGVEQSFVFAEPLPGTGELVVRGRLASDLAAPLGEHAALAFTAPGLGGVRFGAVTGVDARGQTSPGSLRYDGSALELVLPAAFVDGAAYPLVLDPLIGGSFVVPGFGDFDEARPDVAYDNGNSLYLVVWHREFSSTDYDIHAQRVSTSGSLVGGLIFVENAEDTFAVNATVAGVTLSRRFLVAWQEKTTGSYNIKARVVQALDGAQTSTITVASLSADETDPDAGGERTSADDDALIVWEREDAGIFGAQVSVPVSGNPFVVGSPITVASDTRAYRPSISKSGGDDGRLLVAYNVLFSPGDIDVHMVLLDRNGVLLEGPQELAVSIDSESDPSVDGDGDAWIVAFVWSGGGDSEILCQRVLLSGLWPTLFLDDLVAITSDSFSQYTPSVAWTPGKAFVAWQQDFDLFNDDVYVKGIDSNDCSACEATLPLDASTLWEGAPKLASQYSGGSPGDQVLATWYSGYGGIFGIDGTDIEARRLEAFGGGSVVNMGGGCGPSGSISTSGAIAAGNPSFRVIISGADFYATLALLVIRPPTALYSCGACSVMLAPSQYTVSLFAGGASQTVPLPCDLPLVGAQLDTQWVVLPTSTVSCPVFGNLAVSDRLRLTIGQ